MHERGDLDKGFADADAVVERTFTTKPVHQGYIEPHAAVADAGQNNRASVWCSSQGHFAMRTMTAQVLGWDPTQLKVTPAEIGGGFGGKTVIYLEPLAVMLSLKSARPVRVVMDRDEVFKATGPTSGTKIRAKVGVTNDGMITAADVWMGYEAGAFPGSPVGAAGMTVLACYDIPNFFVRRLRRGRQQAEGRRLPRSGCADGSVRRGERARRARASGRRRPGGDAAEERGRGRNAGRLRTEVPEDRLRRNTRSGQEPRALRRPAR